MLMAVLSPVRFNTTSSFIPGLADAVPEEESVVVQLGVEFQVAPEEPFQ